MHPSTISVLSLFMRWAIIGGGVLGTSLALRLRQQGHDVTLFEAADNLGGLAAPWAMGHDVQWDRHYHVTLLSDRRTNAYFDMLGLSDALLWGTPRTGYYGRDHVLRPATACQVGHRTRQRFGRVHLVDHSAPLGSTPRRARC